MEIMIRILRLSVHVVVVNARRAPAINISVRCAQTHFLEDSKESSFILLDILLLDIELTNYFSV